jgi:hypothetical protein
VRGARHRLCQKCLQNGENLLVGLHTDTRAAFIGRRLNPMMYVPLDYVVDDEETLTRRTRIRRRSG